MCVLGKRLLRVAINDCHKNVSGPLHDMFCPNSSLSCDQYYSTHDVSIVNGIKGLSSGVIMGRPIFRKEEFKIKFFHFRQYL
jgi:potassium/chloride transporter 4/5/6